MAGKNLKQSECSVELECPGDIVLDKQTSQVSSLKPCCLSAELRDFSIKRDSAPYSEGAQNDAANLCLACPMKTDCPAEKKTKEAYSPAQLHGNNS